MKTVAESVAYMREGFVPFSEANVSVASAPVLYGLCIYTVLSVRYNEENNKLYIFRLQDHWDRLVQSARIMDFGDFLEHWNYERFSKAVHELLGQNEVKQDALVRVNVFVDEILTGTRMHGLKNAVNMFTYAYVPPIPKETAHLGIASWHRTNDNAIPARAKINGSYVNSSLIKNEALLNGFDDAISLDDQGHVCESSVANIFLVRHNKLITPDNATSLLEGITRRSIMELGEHLGIPTEHRQVDRSELYVADEVFLCGTTARITPVTEIDHRKLGHGAAGECTLKLIEAMNKLTIGKDEHFKHWLTDV